MSSKRTVDVQIRGREFKIRTDEDDESMHRVAALLDQALLKVEQHTGTVDSLDVALLTALNLARELIEAREAGESAPSAPVEGLAELIDRVESTLDAAAPA